MLIAFSGPDLWPYLKNGPKPSKWENSLFSNSDFLIAKKVNENRIKFSEDSVLSLYKNSPRPIFRILNPLLRKLSLQVRTVKGPDTGCSIFSVFFS